MDHADIVQLIERLEEEFGPVAAGSLLALLAVSRSGLSKRDLWACLDGDREPAQRTVVMLLRRMKKQVKHSGNLFSFCPTEFGSAVRQRYLTASGPQRECVGRLAQELRRRLNPPEMSPWRGPFPRGLCDLPQVLAYGALWNDLRDVLTDFAFLEAKCAEFGPQTLVEDYELACLLRGEASDASSHEDATVLRLIGDALRLSMHALEQDRQQLASQLVGRLQDIALAKITSLVQQACASHQSSWLRPVAVRLTPPGGPLLQSIPTDIGVAPQLCLLTDGRRAAVASWYSGTVQVWDLHTGRSLRTLNAVSCYLVGGHRVLAATDMPAKVWDLDMDRRLPSETSGLRGTAGLVLADGRRIVSSFGRGVLEIRNLETGEVLQTFEGHSDRVECLAATPDGRCLISGSKDQTVRIWNIESGEALRTLAGHSGCVAAVAVTPDGRQAISGSHDHTLRIWDIASGAVLHTLVGHSGPVLTVIVTPDGRRVVSGSADNMLKVWDLETGREQQTLAGHSGSVKAVCALPDGRRVASISSDGTLEIWDLNFDIDKGFPGAQARMLGVEP